MPTGSLPSLTVAALLVSQVHLEGIPDRLVRKALLVLKGHLARLDPKGLMELRDSKGLQATLVRRALEARPELMGQMDRMTVALPMDHLTRTQDEATDRDVVGHRGSIADATADRSVDV